MEIRIDLFVLSVSIGVVIMGCILAWICDHSEMILNIENKIEELIGIDLYNEDN